MLRIAFMLFPLCLILTCHAVQGADFSRESIEFFEKEIRPLLAAKCFSCHGRGKTLEAKLSLTSRASVLRGGENGPAAVIAKPADSLLIKAVGFAGELKMPPEGRLHDAQIALLSRWIEIGLPWPDEPDDDVASTSASGGEWSITEQQRKHWSFQPLAKVTPPAVRNRVWTQSTIDEFILAKLEQQGISPAPPVGKPVLLRRVTFDLIGLPPTQEELHSFLADDSPRAFARVVDRLLASPHYGEKWGRHWLDVARYADSTGKDENHACANAFRFRDFVVNALNRDQSFDHFLRQQLAGDLLPAGSDEERHENLIATGFLQLGPKALAEQDKPKLLMDIADEQIEVVGKAFLGLTVSCGRCHDHKLEPIPQRDYYALAGIFRSTRTMEDLAFVSKWLETPLPTAESNNLAATHRQQLEQAEKELKDLTGGNPEAIKEAERKRDALKVAAPPEIAAAMAVSEGEVGDIAINIRGNHLNLGHKVPRGFLQIVSLPTTPEIPAEQSGRLQLANWLARPDHPLTARVMVNRVWLWHFGEGLVPTPDNFGLSGASPIHGELLDHLAAEFIASGWSLKALHRKLLLSSTYQTSSIADPRARELDPENQYRGRFGRRRLTAEELRDALLAVSGQLDQQLGGNLFNYVNREPHVTYYKGPVKYEFVRRSIYLPVIRNAMLDLFDLFDHGDALISLGKRDETTVATQSLYLLNSELVLQAAERVQELTAAQGGMQGERIARIYQVVLNRQPEPAEISSAGKLFNELDQRLVVHQPDAVQRERLRWQAFCHTLLISNEFLTVE